MTALIPQLLCPHVQGCPGLARGHSERQHQAWHDMACNDYIRTSSWRVRIHTRQDANACLPVNMTVLHACDLLMAFDLDSMNPPKILKNITSILFHHMIHNDSSLAWNVMECPTCQNVARQLSSRLSMARELGLENAAFPDATGWVSPCSRATSLISFSMEQW